MSYYFSRILDVSFDEAIQRTTEELHKEGKKKLDVDFRPYRILGACNPPFAYQALQAEDKIGTMLPCNVIVQQLEEGRSEVAAIDPIASMRAVDNPNLSEVAQQIQNKLRQVIANL